MDILPFPRLISIFYSEFHPIQGPKVIYEVPDETLIFASNPTFTPGKDCLPILTKNQLNENRLFDFEAISDFIIPKTQLCNNILTFISGSCKVVGFPMIIENRKYERNALMFNLCWVFDSHVVVNSYEPIICKMAVLLRSLEIESEFLSDHNKRKSLLPAMEHILEDLNNMSEARITLSKKTIIYLPIFQDSLDIINLKLFPIYRKPVSFDMYEVPVPIAELPLLVDSTWDITTIKLLKFIDGINHVKRIISLSEIEIGIACKSLEHLLYYGCIVMVDLFQFSNIYAVRPSINRTIENVILQRECMAYLFKPGVTSPSFAKVFSLYCSLKPGLTLHQWVDENQVDSLNLDVRLHKYPVLLSGSSDFIPSGLLSYLDGKHHYDEICVEFGYSAHEMDEVFSKDPAVKFIFQ